MRGGEDNLPMPRRGRMQTKPVGTQSEAPHQLNRRGLASRRARRNGGPLRCRLWTACDSGYWVGCAPSEEALGARMQRMTRAARLATAEDGSSRAPDLLSISAVMVNPLRFHPDDGLQPGWQFIKTALVVQNYRLPN